MSDEQTPAPKKSWISRGVKTAIGAPLTASIAVWGYSTFADKTDVNARLREQRHEIRAVRTELDAKVFQQFTQFQTQLEGIRKELAEGQRETNRRIDRLIEISKDNRTARFIMPSGPSLLDEKPTLKDN